MAGRIGGPKVRNGNTWTEARFRSFIKSALRRTTTRWGPISSALKSARVDRGQYRCAGCRSAVPLTAYDQNGKRVKNVHVDHIIPVVDPEVGFTTWDSVIERMFVEADGLQILCNDCHTKKTNEEKALAKARRERLKQEDDDD